jgi:hypothetical protein
MALRRPSWTLTEARLAALTLPARGGGWARRRARPLAGVRADGLPTRARRVLEIHRPRQLTQAEAPAAACSTRRERRFSTASTG